MTVASLARQVRFIGTEPRDDFAPTREFDESPSEKCTGNANTCPNAYHHCAECHGVNKDRASVNLTKLEAELSRNPLEEIALLVKALTYGEMMELGEALWKVKGESEVTQAALPGILHRWATGRGIA